MCEINFIFNSKFKIENLILKHLPELLPIFVIEGFKKILTNVLNSSLPSNPKFIITASAFDNDENFKIYLADKKDKRLLLFAEMKLPGEAWLEFKIVKDRLYQRAVFRPKGVWGRLYWYMISPLHAFVFEGMINALVKPK